jgi:hypothetical protein
MEILPLVCQMDAIDIVEDCVDAAQKPGDIAAAPVLFTGLFFYESLAR